MCSCIVLSLAKQEKGSTVQIKVPVVATVIQRRGENGSMSMTINAPGPSLTDQPSESNTYIFTANMNDIAAQENNSGSSDNTISQPQIEFLDETGNMITEEEFHAQSCKSAKKKLLLCFDRLCFADFQQDLSYKNSDVQLENGDDVEALMQMKVEEENKENVNTLLEVSNE